MVDSRAQHRKEKFLLEIKLFEHQKQRGFSSLEIAANLIHNMFMAIEQQIRQKEPNITSQELSERMRKISARELMIRNKCKRTRNNLEETLYHLANNS